MVVQKTIDNLKERPKDERKAVAGGIAILVIAVLLIAWAILFFRKIANGTQQVNFDAGAQNEFNPSNVTQAQQQIQSQSQNQNTDELYQIRNESNANVQQTQPLQIQQVQGKVDAFGNPNNF
jgi:uncharacterized protein HemX